MSFTAVEDAIRDSITPFMSGVTIYFANENGAQPLTPYCMIEIVSFESVGREEMTSTTTYSTGSTTGTMTIREPYEVTAKFVFEGKNTSANNGGDLALEFYSLLNTPLFIQECRKNSISLLRKGIVRRIPVKRETKWYVSFAIDVTFACIIERTQQVDGFDNVYVNATYRGTVDGN